MRRLRVKKIASFLVDHTKLKRGLYISRIDGDATTYDLRVCVPNGGDYMANPAMHTIEHLLATYVRDSRWGQQILYAGPMGCRTGFYLITRSVPEQAVIELVRDAFAFIAAYEGEIPGNSAAECGNFREHDLTDAKRWAARYEEILSGWTSDMLAYSWHNRQTVQG